VKCRRWCCATRFYEEHAAWCLRERRREMMRAAYEHCRIVRPRSRLGADALPSGREGR
jgi:hypothetical protein